MGNADFADYADRAVRSPTKAVGAPAAAGVMTGKKTKTQAKGDSQLACVFVFLPVITPAAAGAPTALVGERNALSA